MHFLSTLTGLLAAGTVAFGIGAVQFKSRFNTEEENAKIDASVKMCRKGFVVTLSGFILSALSLALYFDL